MPGSGHRTQANRALVARLEQHDTGRLRVGRGAAELHVCVWDGEIVAATSRDDLRHVLRRLLIAGELKADEVATLLERAESGEPVFGELLDRIEGEVISTILQDRFVENLTRYLGSGARPRFAHCPAVFEDNFQLGHDANTLLQASADAWDDAMSIDLDIEVFGGAAPPRNGLQRVVLGKVQQGATVGKLLVQLPVEPFSARALVARMLRAHVLDTATSKDADSNARPALTSKDRVLDSDEVSALARSTDSGEVYVPDAHTPISVSSVLPAANSPEESDDPPTEPSVGVAEIDADAPPTEEVSKEALNVQLPVEESGGDLVNGAGNLSSLEAWMDHGVDVDEDLEAFSDHDNNRGDSAGEFRTQEHNLDRVEVVDTLDDKLEMNPQPSAKFGAPVLSDEDAQAKLDVGNKVLRAVSAALDEAEGTGRGQAMLQVLMDGSPGPDQALFSNLNAENDGSLPEASLLRNLRQRPPTEHRRMLNQGLLNLIERALSMAVEELPDEAIDAVLENVAGYRQRLGL
ncbi:MAG: hypothetical protein AB8H79_12840 [Myxococcota bacterium]